MPTATSSDDRIYVSTDETWAGAVILVDYADTATTKVQIERDGVRVRSGDPAWAPGGLAAAYDHEAPLGAVASWRTRPVYSDGSVGAWSQPAILTVPSMASAVDCWVKPVDDPSKAMSLQLHSQRVEELVSHRVQPYAVQGRALPGGSWDRRSPAPLQMTLRTDSNAQKDALAAALDLGPVLVQLLSSYGIADFYALPTDETRRYFVGMFSPLRDVQVAFQPIQRPATIDAPLRVPTHSYANNLAVAPTYPDSEDLWPTYGDALFGGLTMGDLIPGTGGSGGGL